MAHICTIKTHFELYPEITLARATALKLNQLAFQLVKGKYSLMKNLFTSRLFTSNVVCYFSSVLP